MKMISFKKMLKAKRFTTVTALNKREYVTVRLLIKVAADIETNIIDSLKRSWMLVDVT